MNIINKLIPYLNLAFISVYFKGEFCVVTIELLKNKKSIKKETIEFKTQNQQIPKDAISYINRFQKKYKLSYISTLLKTINQGAVPDCSRVEFQKLNIKTDNLDIICIDEFFSAFASVDEIRWERNVFENVGVDFLFSPFAIIYDMCKKKFEKNPVMFVLLQHDSVAICISKIDKFLFSAYFITSTSEQIALKAAEVEHAIEDTDSDSGLDDLISLDDLDDSSLLNDIEPIEGFDSLDEVEELKDLDTHDISSDSFIDSTDAKAENEDGKHKSEQVDDSSLELFQKAIDLIKFIQNSLNEFYKNDVYESDFISKIHILDTINFSSDVQSYISDEL
ncbi:MAG: hypothetical protein HXX81_01170, partial [Campylobacterales bacterium]|nr:hypothetical protein [Campylobacterales bacterium]